MTHRVHRRAWLAGLVIMLSLGAYVAAQFQGVGKTFASLWGLPAWQSVAIGASVVLVYTTLGGLWAVSLTDTLQGLMMALTSIILPVAALLAVGVGDLVPALRGVDVPGYLDPFRGAGPAAAIGFVLGLLGIGLG